MDLHGQSVRVLSQAGAGTTVEFTLQRPADGTWPTRPAAGRVPSLAQSA